MIKLEIKTKKLKKKRFERLRMFDQPDSLRTLLMHASATVPLFESHGHEEYEAEEEEFEDSDEFAEYSSEI